MMNLILKRYIYICKLAVQTESVLEFQSRKRTPWARIVAAIC